ncbi:hypothetical protein GQ600_18795 [Phytophthora cactorum]|nr:hypothetical protein GQ600_18795 [Phytophthora cactorum]
MRKNLAFLQKTFTSDVAMGNSYFGDARLHLQRLESMAPGVMKATARLHVTIQNSSKYDINPPLRERLKGKHLDCSVSIDFQFGRRQWPRDEIRTSYRRDASVASELGDLSDVVEVCYSLSDDAREGF